MNYMLLDCSGKGAVVNVPREVVKYFFGLFQERRSAAIWQHDICAEVFSKFEGSPSHFSRKWQSNSSLGGLPYMTSAVGGGRGVPKKQTKGTKSDDLWQWQGGGCQKSENFADVIYGSPLYGTQYSRVETVRWTQPMLATCRMVQVYFPGQVRNFNSKLQRPTRKREWGRWSWKCMPDTNKL